jgi:plasmid stabilization system protein ParE
MRYDVSVLPAAETEILEAFTWYFERSPVAARAFRTEVFSAMDRLAEDPTMWPRDAEGVHYYVLNRFPYTLHYEITASVVTVLAVAHQRRRPRYWHPG